MKKNNNNAGMLVETNTGKRGRTYSHEEYINGKIKVHLFNGDKILCSPEKLKVIGFID